MKRESLKEINNHILTLKLPVSLFGSSKPNCFQKSILTVNSQS